MGTQPQTYFEPLCTNIWKNSFTKSQNFQIIAYSILEYLTSHSLLLPPTSMEKSLRIFRVSRAWSGLDLVLQRGCDPEPCAHWPFQLCTVEFEVTLCQGEARRRVPYVSGLLWRGTLQVLSNDSRWEVGSL